MKKLLILVAIIASFASCQKTPQEKAEILINDYFTQQLSHPDTYEPIVTELDSAFSPFDSPEFYIKTCKMIDLYEKMEEMYKRVEKARMTMALGILSLSASGFQDCIDAKDDVEKVLDEFRKDSVRIESLASELKEELSREPEFIGYKARHEFRAKDDANKRIIGQYKFLFDPQLTSISDVYDMEEEEYCKVREIYNEMVGEE